MQTVDPKRYHRRNKILSWFVDQNTEKPNYSTIIFFADKARLIWDENFNSHNGHTWAETKACDQGLGGYST
jgi:hypothetical protein